MSRRPPTPLHAARRRAAAELNLPIDDWQVVRLATALCHYDTVQARAADCDPSLTSDEVAKATALVVEARSSVPRQHTLTVEIVRPVRVRCPSCRTEYDPNTDPPMALPPQQPLGVSPPSRSSDDATAPRMAFGKPS